MSGLILPLCSISLLALFFITFAFFKSDWNLHMHSRSLFTEEISHLDHIPHHNVLGKKLQERRKQLMIYYAESGNNVEALSGKNAQHVLLTRNEWDARTQDHLISSAMAGEIGCNQLRYMKNVDFLGAGYTKIVVKGILPNGFPVALKSVNEKGSDLRACFQNFKNLDGCRQLVSYKLLKEILLLQRLRHPNLIKFQGLCLWSLQTGLLTAAFEQGSPLEMIQLLQSPWEDRFRVCLGLVRLLQYLSQSPLGSVALLDFQPRQFVLVDGELKLTDLDDASIEEPKCRTEADCVLQFPVRNFSNPCSPDGLCRGLNERRNLYNAYRYFFTYLLPHQAPPTLRSLIDQIMNSTGELKSNVRKTREAFEEILYLYKSGLYLQTQSPSSVKGWRLVSSRSGFGDSQTDVDSMVHIKQKT
ncbi:hypothetical protein GJAV_G00021640 [Gymnothorax javanicus]|nr:hypothetical protein GJAV_G00021640 [Gymnothorax javanicus]